MIRTTCPKCGREDAVADYLAMLPIMCNGCGTRVTVGERLATNPLFPPPVVPPPPPKAAPPPPPKAAPPLPPPPKAPPPPPLKAKRAVPPPLVEAKATPIPPPPPEPEPELGEVVSSSPVFYNTNPASAFPGVEETDYPPPESPPDDSPPDDAPPESPPDPIPVPPAPDIPRARPAVSTVKVPRPSQAPRAAERAMAPTSPESTLPLAGVGRRLLARFLFVLGLAMMVGLGFAILMIVPNSVKRDAYIMWAIVAAFPLIYLLVNAAMLARTGQDIGKRYAGVRVVNADGSKATEAAALIKRDALTFVIGLTGIGVLYWLADFVTLFSKGGRTLHDRIAGTRVVRA